MEQDFTVLNVVIQIVAALIFCFVILIVVVFVVAIANKTFYTNEDYRFSLEKYDFTVKVEYRSLSHLMHCIDYMKYNPYDIKTNYATILKIGRFIIKHKSCTINVFGVYNMNKYLTCGEIDDIHNSISELGYKLENKIKEKIKSNDESLYINEV